MKNSVSVFSVISTFLAMSASIASAADLTLDQNTADLGACNGTAKLVKTSDGKAELRISGVRRCSNMTLQMKLDHSDANEFNIALPLSLGKDADVQLTSNSGTTSAHLLVNTNDVDNSPEVVPNTTLQLRNCFGTMKFNSSSSVAPTMVFKDVKNCTRFKIVSVNGRPFSYSMNLQVETYSRGGSFTLPSSAYQYGRNKVKVLVEGPLNDDQFVLNFYSY
jgi:hypothetical protein